MRLVAAASFGVVLVVCLAILGVQGFAGRDRPSTTPQPAIPSSAGVAATAKPPAPRPAPRPRPVLRGPTTAESLGRSPEARRSFDAALRSRLADGRGAFEARLDRGRLRVVDRGSYSLRPRRSRTLRLVEDRRTSAKVELRTLAARRWLRVRSLRPARPQGLRCWTQYQPRQLARVPVIGYGDAGPQALPEALLVATHGEGRQLAGDGTEDVVGTTDLRVAVGLLGGVRALADLGVSGREELVVVRFRIAGGRLIGYRIEMADLYVALRHARARLRPGWDRPADWTGTAVARFSEVRGGVRVAAPAPQRVVPLTSDLRAFRERAAACEQRSGG